MSKQQAMDYAQGRANRLSAPVYVWFYGWRWWTADKEPYFPSESVTPEVAP